jgi:hypothetical protein
MLQHGSCAHLLQLQRERSEHSFRPQTPDGSAQGGLGGGGDWGSGGACILRLRGARAQLPEALQQRRGQQSARSAQRLEQLRNGCGTHWLREAASS